MGSPTRSCAPDSLQLCWELEAYPEVPPMLKALKQGGFATAILSNGSPDMLMGAVENAGIGAVWANRAGEPMDRLPWRPAHVLSDLTTIPEIAATP